MARLLELLSPFTGLEQLQKRLDRLQHVLEYKRSRLKSAPAGKLKVITSHGTYQFACMEKNKCIYIPKGKSNLAEQLAQKEYDEAVLPLIEQEIMRLEKVQKLLQDGLDNAFNKLHPAKKALVQPVTLSDQEYARQWLSRPYKKNPGHREHAVYTTSAGILVRSKSEVIIADTLYHMNIPFRYEPALEMSLPGQESRLVYPDFCCLKVRTRQEFYWEHFGLMDQADYAEKAVFKLNAYEASDARLISTFETVTQPLQPSHVKALITRYLM